MHHASHLGVGGWSPVGVHRFLAAVRADIKSGIQVCKENFAEDQNDLSTEWSAGLGEALYKLAFSFIIILL